MIEAVEFVFFQMMIKHTFEQILTRYKNEKAIFEQVCAFLSLEFCHFGFQIDKLYII